MKAIQLTGLNGFDDLRVVEVERPKPGPGEILLEVRAAGVNFAELEQTTGKYPLFKPLPFVMGFEAAGVVTEMGVEVNGLKRGDRVTGIVASGGFAEFAVADAANLIPIPDNVDFNQATTIAIQGVTAYALLKYAAEPKGKTVLIQAAAGGVGLFLVQLAKILGAKKIIALASSWEKLQLIKELGADAVIDYSKDGWTVDVLNETDGKGVDIVFEMASGKTGDDSISLAAPFGRVVFYGAKNMYTTLNERQMQQLIHKNQTFVGFNIPTYEPEKLGPCVSPLLQLISEGKVKLFAKNIFSLERVKEAFEAIAGRNTIGRVVLVP
jgi:NADPH2:quinone reductase